MNNNKKFILDKKKLNLNIKCKESQKINDKNKVHMIIFYTNALKKFFIYLIIKKFVMNYSNKKFVKKIERAREYFNIK